MLKFLRPRQVKVLKPFGSKIQPPALRVSLCDVNPDMADAWIDTFRDLEAVEILSGDLLTLHCDALVSPANSFGDMSGGIDQYIDRFYGGAAQKAVVEAIRAEHFGELPVGAAVVIPMGTHRFPHLVVAPTMRVPGNVADTPNAYLAMRAALVAVLRYNRTSAAKITSLAVPGMCTGVGGMSCGMAALQMRAAYDNVLGEGWKEIVHPAMAPFAMGRLSRKKWSWTGPAGDPANGGDAP